MTRVFGWGRAVLRWLGGGGDWILMVVLVALAYYAVRYPPTWLQPAPSGSLAGALFSGAAMLLASAINRANQRSQAVEEAKRRREKLEKLLTAELRTVAYKLIAARETLELALQASQTQSSAAPPNVRRYRPRELRLTEDLAADLLLLDGATIDELVRLESRLSMIRTMMDETEVLGSWHASADELSKEIAACLFVLANAFEWIAPEAMLHLPGREIEPAANILRKLAQPAAFRD